MVEEAQNKAKISNFQIEKALENIDDEDINNSFLGIFLSNYIE